MSSERPIKRFMLNLIISCELGSSSTRSLLGINTYWTATQGSPGKPEGWLIHSRIEEILWLRDWAGADRKMFRFLQIGRCSGSCKISLVLHHTLFMTIEYYYINHTCWLTCWGLTAQEPAWPNETIKNYLGSYLDFHFSFALYSEGCSTRSNIQLHWFGDWGSVVSLCRMCRGACHWACVLNYVGCGSSFQSRTFKVRCCAHPDRTSLACR